MLLQESSQLMKCGWLSTASVKSIFIAIFLKGSLASVGIFPAEMWLTVYRRRYISHTDFRNVPSICAITFGNSYGTLKESPEHPASRISFPGRILPGKCKDRRFTMLADGVFQFCEGCSEVKFG